MESQSGVCAREKSAVHEISRRKSIEIEVRGVIMLIASPVGFLERSYRVFFSNISLEARVEAGDRGFCRSGPGCVPALLKPGTYMVFGYTLIATR